MPTAAATPRLSLQGLQSPLAGPFSLDLAAGQCAVVTGESGSGKSLFLRMIADLDDHAGEALLDGAPRAGFAPPDWRRKVCYVAAETGWWADEVKACLPKDRVDQARVLAARLGLPDALIDGPVARLSTGERQRLALVRALLLQPPVLLLDEPTGALDEGSTDKVEAVIREAIAGGAAVVMVTHDEALAGRMANQRYRMADRTLSAL